MFRLACQIVINIFYNYMNMINKAKGIEIDVDLDYADDYKIEKIRIYFDDSCLMTEVTVSLMKDGFKFTRTIRGEEWDRKLQNMFWNRHWFEAE